MKVYFQNTQGTERLIATCSTDEEIWIVINNFLKERDYKSSYSRIWKENGNFTIDVGSHSEFFIVKDWKESEFFCSL